MNDEEYMRCALEEARKAFDLNEVPVGAVVVYRGEIIGKAHNLKETLNDVSAHAEILAIKEASKALNTWKLDECTIYITMEPCLMCYSAIKDSRIKKIYCSIPQQLSKKKSFRYYIDESQLDIQVGIMQEESEKLIKIFFKRLRG